MTNFSCKSYLMDFDYHNSIIFEWLLLILFNEMDLTSSCAIQPDVHKENIRCFSNCNKRIN